MTFKKSILLASLISFSGFCTASASFTFSDQVNTQNSDQIVFVDDVNALDGAAGELNSRSGGQLAKLLALNEFDAKAGSTLHLQMVAGVNNLWVVGSADEDGLSAPELQNLGGKIAASVDSLLNDVNVDVFIDNLNTNLPAPSAYLAQGYHMRHYSFDKYKTKKDAGKSDVHFVTGSASDAEAAYQKDLRYIAEGIHFARDFATEPGKSMYPALFADRVRAKLKGLDNVNVRVLDVKDMQKLNMGALLGVGKGSIHDPRLIIVEYMGGKKGDAPIALAGKGITFDTGGISLKQNSGMWAMKSDLSGAAAVAGTMYAIAKRGEKVNVVGLMAMAENMPSRDAIRPGDVLNTMKGTSIEIMSTDAEGRLVLSDAVYYAQEKYQPKMLLNIATLTGSAARALSKEYAALITRDFELSTQMMAVGERSGEHVWPLPLHPNHFKQIESPIADIKNSGAGNPGASIGAAVIGSFVAEDLPWIHLDIAGVDWLDSDIDVSPKGSQGWGVRFMDQLVRENK
ncbi:leucyl aminopeptidase [Glaciecola petra]|uniref:Leucyl aminopeptidase n=1 Tax=Glaciecola petra TaxID=3075602 RepID=A0ABU2ZYW0_9ALTE|nr:leucyl aminopeptidase [Aestuariibacter sp. P117]MDT0596617.1 leucyl aminopeptidase [Aestuariibacter sp. P117]